MCVYRVTGFCIHTGDVCALVCFHRVMKRAVSLESTNDRKGKHFIRLLELQKVAPKAKSCSKVAEHNRNRPTDNSNPRELEPFCHFHSIFYSITKPGKTRKRASSSPQLGS